MEKYTVNELGFDTKGSTPEHEDHHENVESKQDNNLNKVEKKEDNEPEDTLNNVADIVLYVGTIVPILAFFIICFNTEDSTSRIVSLVIACGIVLATIIARASMKVLVNISLTLKEIKKSKGL